MAISQNMAECIGMLLDGNREGSAVRRLTDILFIRCLMPWVYRPLIG